MPDLPSFDRLVLGVVSILGDGDAGEIMEAVEEGGASYGAVYASLMRLRERGFVTRQFVLWSITEAGRFALARELTDKE